MNLFEAAGNLIPTEFRFYQLSNPFKIFEFDFWRRPDSHRETEFFVKAIDHGTVHGVVSW